MVVTPTSEQVAAYMPVPLTGLVAEDAVPFPLFLSTAHDTWVLYRPDGAMLDESHVGRLMSEGVNSLWIRTEDKSAYFERVEVCLSDLLLDSATPLENRVDVLYGVSQRISTGLLEVIPDGNSLKRAQRVMIAVSSLMTRDSSSIQAVRHVLEAGPGLARHGLTTAFLSMGLARIALGGDPALLAMSGLAGLLHDAGRIGHEELEHDPEHTTRGAALLRRLGLPAAVVEVAQSHHECDDGSGFPAGLGGKDIPELARLVIMVNLFDKVYNEQDPRVGVFDALRILAQAYRGVFSETMAHGLVKMFR